MKLHILGSGSIDTHRLSASYLIDDTMLLDCPNGIIKHMKGCGVDIKGIDTVYISHFHADHYFDLPFLLMDRGLFAPCEKTLTMIGQPELKDKLTALMRLAYPDVADRVIDNCNINFVTIKDGDTITHKDYTMRFYSVDHHVIPSIGLRISSGAHTAAFSFDTTYCDNLHPLIQDADIAVVEMASLDTSPVHMGEDSIKKLMHAHPDTRIITTHTGDASFARAKTFVETAEDNMIVEL